MNLDYFRTHIKDELKAKGLTLNSLSEKADLSEDTLRSLIYGKSKDVMLSTIIKIADALDCSIDYLIGHNHQIWDDELFDNIKYLPASSIQTLKTLISIELNSMQASSEKGTDIIPVLVPSKPLKDGDYYDSGVFIEHDISNYPNHLKRLINLGLMLKSDEYKPQYYSNDILLLSTEKRPEYNDYVVYQDKNGRIYIRRYSQSGLEPINSFGKMILPKDEQEYHAIGVIIKSLKEFNLEQYR